MMPNKVYIFFYCGCIYESDSYPMSIHYTFKGAYKAMIENKLKSYSDWYEERMIWGKRKTRTVTKHGSGELWHIGRQEILE